MNAIMVRPTAWSPSAAAAGSCATLGSGWVNLGSGTSQTLNGVWGVSADDFWVCGGNGLIRRYATAGSGAPWLRAPARP
jgi:hypothetical protein